MLKGPASKWCGPFFIPCAALAFGTVEVFSYLCARFFRKDMTQTRHRHSSHPLISNRMAFGVVGCLEAAWSPLVPYVKSAFSLDEGQLGTLMLCSGLGSVLALPFAGVLCSRFGVKKTVWTSAFLMIAALLSISLLVSVSLTAAMLLVFGACTIFIDVSSNINGIVLERKLRHHLMSGFHGGYSLGTLIGALVMSILFSIGLVPFAAIAITTLLTLVTVLLGSRGLLGAENLPDERGASKGERKRIPAVVIVIGFLCFIMYASEGSILGWGAVFANENRGVDMKHAGFMYVAFAVMMTITRFLGDWLVYKLGQRRVIVCGAVLACAGFAIAALVPHVAATVIGFAMVGLGAANLVPQLVSYAGEIPGIAVQNAVSIINAIGYMGILVGPVAIGFIARHFGLEVSFCCISALCFVVGVVTYFMLGRSRKVRQ